MTNVIDFQSRQPTSVTETQEDETTMPKLERPAFSFDTMQADIKGFVSIDACVPLQLAAEFMALLAKYREEADTTAQSAPRRSRKNATAQRGVSAAL